jgi:hypothetical protein
VQFKYLFILAPFLLAPLTAAIPLPMAPDLSAVNPSSTGPDYSNANAAAIHFLSIVDNQVYSGAWLEAGGLMHDIVPKEVWAAGIRAIRQNLGSVRTRKVSGHQSTDRLPAGTGGEFMIIRYQTQFSRQPNSKETVTLIRESPLGLWKVVSYSIRK